MTDISCTANIFDEHYIYGYLNKRITTAKCYNDLHNLIHELLPMNELKSILLNQLTKIKQKHKQKQKMNVESPDTNRLLLQKLYLRSASLEEIFSDHILVNIIRFVPSAEYIKMPCISRNFRSIMKKYPSVYAQYTVHAVLDHLLLHNDGVVWIAVNHALQSIRIISRPKNASIMSSVCRNDSLSIRRQFEEDVVFNDANAIKYEIHNVEDITTKIPFIWYHCKKWNIESVKKIPRKLYSNTNTHSSMISYNKSVVSPKLSIIQTQAQTQMQMLQTRSRSTSESAETNIFFMILNKCSKYIESIRVDAINDKDAPKWSIINDLTLYKLLNHLSINQVMHNAILESWLTHQQQLKGIQYIELNHLTQQMDLDKLKQLIESCNNLIAFDCYISQKNNEQNQSQQPLDVAICIKFPKNIQFIRLQFVSECFQIDLTECTQLCALYLNDTLSESDHSDEKNENILWPETGGVECLLLEQAMDDIHNMNMTLPSYVNKWYNSLKSNSLIPVRWIRYITHPFMETHDSNTYETDEDDDSVVPGPPMLMNAIPIRASATSPDMQFTSIKYDDYMDPLRYEKDTIDFINLEQIKNIVFQNNSNHATADSAVIRVLHGDDDELYVGYLWKLLLRLKCKDENIYRKHLKIYQRWFDIGIGVWIRELGVEFVKQQFGNAKWKFLHPYSRSNSYRW